MKMEEKDYLEVQEEFDRKCSEIKNKLFEIKSQLESMKGQFKSDIDYSIQLLDNIKNEIEMVSIKNKLKAVIIQMQKKNIQIDTTQIKGFNFVSQYYDEIVNELAQKKTK